MIEVRDKKMSKSDGLKNEWILRNLLDRYSPNIIKFYMLSTHYRSPLEFSSEKIKESQRAMDKIINTFLNLGFLIKKESGIKKDEKIAEKKIMENEKIIDEVNNSVIGDFEKYMNDDFNSAGATGVLFEAIKKINSIIQSKDFIYREESVAKLKLFFEKVVSLFKIFGINIEDEISARHLKENSDFPGLTNEEIEELIKKRDEARKARNFAKSDEIRKALSESGIVLEDRKEGTIWKRLE
jgi:cysteinyl-tRNA synthetase